MFVQKLYEKKTGKTLLYYATGKRVSGVIQKKYVSKIGYIEDFLDQYSDPLEHFKQEAKRLTQEEKNMKQSLEFSLSEHFNFSKSFDKTLDTILEASDLVRSYGVLPLLQIYRDLEIDYFLNIKRQYKKAEYNHNHIFQMLVFGRILSPDSKLATWRERNKLLQSADFSDDDVYRSLSFFSNIKDDMIAHLNKQMCDKYGRRTTLMYYDVTNYYWEIDDDDDLRMRGVCKEHRPNPIVQMGLFMDSKGLPVTYGLFPGNTNDVITMRPMMNELVTNMGNENIIYVADKGMMSGMNIAQIIIDHNGYVISSSVRGSTEEMKKYVKTQEGYIESVDGSFKYKSRIIPRKIRIQTFDGKISEMLVNERQVVFWSKKYQERAKYDRDKAIEKALSRAGKGENTVLNNHAGNRFIAKIIFDSEDGKLIKNPEFGYEVNEKLKAQEEELDGYYVIRSNVFGLLDEKKPFSDNPDKVRWHKKDGILEMNKVVSALDIVDMYRGLWQIEQSFRITKSILKARPVFVYKEESIRAHFLSCFVSLLIIRLLEKKTEEKIPVETLVDSLRNANLTKLSNGCYQNLYCDNVIDAIAKACNLDLTKKYYSANDLKNLEARQKNDVTVYNRKLFNKACNYCYCNKLQAFFY